jgi:methyl-accepting chemotaxis protein
LQLATNTNKTSARQLLSELQASQQYRQPVNPQAVQPPQDAQSTVAILQAELSAARQQAGLECGSAVWARQQVKDLSKQLQEAREQVAQHGRDVEESKQKAAAASQQMRALGEVNAALQARLQEAAAAAAASAAASKAEAAEWMMQLKQDAEKCEQQAAEADKQVKVLQEINAALQGRLQEAAAAAAAAAAAKADAAAEKAADGRRSNVERSVKARAWVQQQVAELRCSAVQLQRQLDEANFKVGCLGPGFGGCVDACPSV